MDGNDAALHSLQRVVIAPSQWHGLQVQLTPAQQHYLKHVLRLGTGDRFVAMDGQGQAWIARLTQVEASLQAAILEPIQAITELPLAITLVAALPKGTGFDDVVRQATELGVAAIVPVISERTLLQPSPQKLDRWRRIAQEAAEQSERQVVPTIAPPVPFMAHLQAINALPLPRFLCEARGHYPHLLACTLGSSQRKLGDCVVAVGPEGGWTSGEIAAAIAAGYQPVSLGHRILRSLTAPLVALSILAAVSESATEKAPSEPLGTVINSS
jgi:16S rRNA (uracil1498-N3)-methyltransferase